MYEEGTELGKGRNRLNANLGRELNELTCINRLRGINRQIKLKVSEKESLPQTKADNRKKKKLVYTKKY